jgi:hypothetical protein
MAMRDTGVDTDKVREALKSQGFGIPYTLGYTDLTAAMRMSEIKDVVVAEVSHINTQDFQEARTAIAAHGRVTTSKQEDVPSMAQ